MAETDRSARHKRAMQRKKEYVDSRIAAATEDRGLLLVLTGNGKGKSSSAFGMLARSVGQEGIGKDWAPGLPQRTELRYHLVTVRHENRFARSSEPDVLAQPAVQNLDSDRFHALKVATGCYPVNRRRTVSTIGKTKATDRWRVASSPPCWPLTTGHYSTRFSGHL